MRKGNLTDLTVRNLSARAGERIELWDAKLPGFGVRVSPTGTKTFVVLYYLHGRKHRLSLGRFPFITLAEAPGKTLTALGQTKRGIDPKQDDPTPSRKLLFEDVVEEFIEKHCQLHNRASTTYENARLLRSRFVPKWRGRDIRKIDRTEVLLMLDAAIAARTPSAANHALSVVRKLFAWCVERGLIEQNPCLGLSHPAPSKSRERVLSDDELTAVRRAAEDTGYPMGTIAKLLILTAQRRGEVAGMSWSEIDFERKIWTIPGEHT
ncbi:MAG: tyrosine-type recombinase/integrase, partial [Gammaproteobacteria bacterium]